MQNTTTTEEEVKPETGISAETRTKIEAQAVKEISHARIYKQGKILNWQKNENLYYDVKIPTAETRANVNLGRMQEFVHTLQSKISGQKIFEFGKRKEAQLRRVKRLNALRNADRDNDFWDMRMMVGSKQLIIYGREIYNYYADSEESYKPHLTNVDVYDFLIDPAGGGIDMELAMYMGDYGVVMTRKQLEKAKDNSSYIKENITNLLTGTGNNTEVNTEETNKRNRTLGQDTVGQKELQNEDKFKFWRWFTTFEGERYYCLMQEKTGSSIRMEKLVDMFSPTKMYPLSPWPYWSNASFPDLTEFWSKSYSDYVREIFMAQDSSIDQMLDNSEAINKPMKIVNVSAIEDLSKLKSYGKNRIIPTKGNYDANRAVQVLATAPINGPIQVFNILEGIHEKASGVTAGAKGDAQNDSGAKATIYAGNQKNTADRFELLERSRSFGITRFARLYEIGVKDHLIKRVAIDILGPEGVETEDVNRRDIFKKKDDFTVSIKDTDAEFAESLQKQTIKINFLNAELAAQAVPGATKVINPQKAFELKAKAAGLDEDETKELMDLSEFGNSELMSEAARDMESLLDGEDIKPNPSANNAYRSKIVDFMIDHQEDMSKETFDRFAQYVSQLQPIVEKNEVRAMNQFAIKQLESLAAQPIAPGAPVDGTATPELTPVESPIGNGNQVPSGGAQQ